MRKITIVIKTTYSYIEDKKASKKAREHFYEFYANYDRTDAYRSGAWDGKYKAVNPTGSFATGLLPDIADYLFEFYDIEFDDQRSNELKYDFVAVDFLRPYQVDILDKSISHEYDDMPFYRGIVNGATNSGKTYITAAIWKSFKQAPLLFLVHRTKLFKQQLEFFTDFFGASMVGGVNDKMNDFGKPFVVSMYRACGRLNLKKFKILIVDEGHMTKGSLYMKTVNKCKADIRYYITGTPFSVDPIAQYKIKGSSGPELAKVSNRFLIDNGYSAEPIITMVKINNIIPNYIKWQQAYRDYVINNQDRNRFIQKFKIQKIKEGRKVWIVCRHVEHANTLGDLVSAPVMTGQMPKKESDQILEDYKIGKINTVVSTMVIDVGMNLPIEAFVIALGGKSEVDVLQLIGRTVRKTNNFDRVDVLDFYDIGPYVEAHSQERLRIYEEEKFQVSII